MSARAAVAAAERGSRAWRAVVAAQSVAVPDHSDLYGLACELVDTLRALELVAGVVLRQVHGYGEGQVLRDDEGQDPVERLIAVAAHLADLRCALDRADRAANGVWSQVGHIAVEVP